MISPDALRTEKYMKVHARVRGPPGGDNLQSYIFTDRLLIKLISKKKGDLLFLCIFEAAVQK